MSTTENTMSTKEVIAKLEEVVSEGLGFGPEIANKTIPLDKSKSFKYYAGDECTALVSNAVIYHHPASIREVLICVANIATPEDETYMAVLKQHYFTKRGLDYARSVAVNDIIYFSNVVEQLKDTFFTYVKPGVDEAQLVLTISAKDNNAAFMDFTIEIIATDVYLRINYTDFQVRQSSIANVEIANLAHVCSCISDAATVLLGDEQQLKDISKLHYNSSMAGFFAEKHLDIYAPRDIAVDYANYERYQMRCLRSHLCHLGRIYLLMVGLM